MMATSWARVTHLRPHGCVWSGSAHRAVDGTPLVRGVSGARLMVCRSRSASASTSAPHSHVCHVHSDATTGSSSVARVHTWSATALCSPPFSAGMGSWAMRGSTPRANLGTWGVSCHSALRYLSSHGDGGTSGTPDGIDTADTATAATTTTTTVATHGKCSGCGAPLQTTAPDMLGYIPEHLLRKRSPSGGKKPIAAELDDGTTEAFRDYADVLEKHANPDSEAKAAQPQPQPQPRTTGGAAAAATICARCHSLRTHGTPGHGSGGVVRGVAALAPESTVTTTRKGTGHVQVCVADIFDFSSTLGAALRDSLSPTAAATVLVVNKMDLLPSDTKMAERRLLSWVREQPEYQALPPVAAIHFVSAHTGWGLPRLLGRLCKLCAHHGTNAQFIGLTNAGKSTLVNRLLNTGQRQEVTTSPVAGTTLGNLAFRLICDRRHGGPRLFRKGDAPRKAAGIRTVYDTPGIIDPTHLTQFLTPDEQRAIFPAKCTPKLNTVKREQSLLFGGLARIDYVSGDPAHVVLVSFASPHIKMHKTNAARADALVANAAEGGGEGVRPMVLTPPYSEGRADPFPPLSNVTEHTVMGRGWRSKNAAADLVLPGVGWAMVFAPAGTQVVLRASLVPGHPATVRTPLENG